ncbi:MAG TPA: RidA family protein [Gemmatimonadaceae bacterium]|nr:RidA family protein [Gemmatimonadaceae bacterium]
MIQPRHLAIFALSGVAFAAGLFLALRQGGDSAAAAPRSADIEYLTPFGAPTRPFSPAVRVGDVIFLSGQIGTDASANGGLKVGGIEAETRQTLENIKRTVEAVGSSMDKVAKCTVMMADMAEWDRMNVVYREFFPAGRLPARSAFGTSGLALGARVEIECIATR